MLQNINTILVTRLGLAAQKSQFCTQLGTPPLSQVYYKKASKPLFIKDFEAFLGYCVFVMQWPIVLFCKIVIK